jgi:hypothetical protein
MVIIPSKLSLQLNMILRWPVRFSPSDPGIKVFLQLAELVNIHFYTYLRSLLGIAPQMTNKNLPGYNV